MTTIKPTMKIQAVLVLLLSVLTGPLARAGELQSFPDVTLVPTDWADGDSFRVRFPDGEEHTLRLYGADCLEWHVSTDTDARRLRAQRRYFGISTHGESPQESIDLAKFMGKAAAVEVRKLLENPFTVHTAFADGRGDGRFHRIYAFVELHDGRDLATTLVEKGLARAYGVYRGQIDGTSRDEFRELLKDRELVAARKGVGIWSYTDWETLPDERQAERREEEEAQIAMGKGEPTRAVQINTASRDELMQIPGVGEVTANRIIEARPFVSQEDLLRVNGIGMKTLEKIKPYLAEVE